MHLKRLKALNDELLEVTIRALHRLDEYCKAHDIPIVTDDELSNYVGRAIGIIDEINGSNESNDLTSFGFTHNEITAWVNKEPDFTKRIVTPLDSNLHQTRRYQNQTSQCLNEPLNACDRNRNQEPL